MYKIRFLVVISHPVGHKCKDTNICNVASRDSDDSIRVHNVSASNP